MSRILDHMNINWQCDWMKDMVWTNLRFSLLMYRLIKRFSFEKTSMVFKYKTLIANVLVRTPRCKPTASPESQGKCVEQDLCIPSTQTVVLHDPCATTYKQLCKICISFILGMLPFFKLERLTFVYLVTLPSVNLVTLRFAKICS